MSEATPSVQLQASSSYDAILLVSFGGPERPEDVMPFLENVVHGKNVPQERLQEVAKHYELFDGVSPINAEIRGLLGSLIPELHAHGVTLPVYWGNLHWHPTLADTVQQMADDDVRHALAFVTSAFGSYPGCRKYREAIAEAVRQAGPEAPRIDKVRLFYNHPGFIEAMADRVADAFRALEPQRRRQSRWIYVAHSIPSAMANSSPYERQLQEACRLVTDAVRAIAKGAGQGANGAAEGELLAGELPAEYDLVFQSRSGPPSQAWLGPDIRDHFRQLSAAGVQDVIVVPIGFLVEHMEVAYDLDVEVDELCGELGISMVRAGVVGNHARFVQMIRELIQERLDPASPRLALGSDGAWSDVCPEGCCQAPASREPRVPLRNE